MLNCREALNCLIKENEQRIEIMELYRIKKQYDPMLTYNLKQQTIKLRYQFNLIK